MTNEVTENTDITHKKLAIKLNNFDYLHSDVNGSDDNHLYIGREGLIKKLVGVLNKTTGGRGSYLVSGYRGVGKSSFVDKVLSEYKNSKNSNNSELYCVLLIVFVLLIFSMYQLIFKQTDILDIYHENIWYVITSSLFIGLFFLFNKCLENYKKNAIYIKINLGDKINLSAKDIYYSIVNIFIDELNGEYPVTSFVNNEYKKIIFLLMMILLLTFPMISVFSSERLISFNSVINELKIFFSKPVFWLAYFAVPFVFYFFIKRPALEAMNSLDELVLRIENEVLDSKSMGLSQGFLKYGVRRNVKTLPLKAREIEYKLTTIIKELNLKGVNIIFVFDELDKLSERDLDENSNDDKTGKINNLLSAVKNFITTAHARFIFIAGRETMDSYYAERDSANSLYESLFDQVFEIPSLLTAGGQSSQNVEEYVCRRLGCKSPGKPYKNLNEFYNDYLSNVMKKSDLNKEDRENIRLAVLVLRNLINYLCFHSWGNPKRLSSIFENFIDGAPFEGLEDKNYIKIDSDQRPDDKKKINHNQHDSESLCLVFSFNQQRSMAFCNGMFTLFKHQLSREVSIISDKLTVSSLTALQFILKFHQYAFTRESLHRMSEALNSNRSPELNVIVDDLLSHVFKPYIRRVRNGAYRYRFNSMFEQEIRYVSSISEFESSSFNFSLDAMSRVKSYFEKDFLNENACDIVRSKSAIVLGDMNAIEQSFNDASRYYSAAIHFLLQVLYQEKENRIKDLDAEVSYLEVLIKYGDMEEHRQNYNKAAVYYAQANKYLREKYKNCKSDNCKYEDFKPAALIDSKWEIYRLAYWAGLFLLLKRSPISKIEDYIDYELINIIYGNKTNGNIKIFKKLKRYGVLSESEISREYQVFKKNNDPRYSLRLANYYFFNGSENINNSIKNYYYSYVNSKKIWSGDEKLMPYERRDFIEYSALSGFSESSLICESYDLLKKLKNNSHSNVFYESIKECLKSTNKEFYLDDIGNVNLNNLKNIDKNTKIFYSLEKSINGFCDIGLYTNAFVLCFKLISYKLTMLDMFSDKSELKNYEISKDDVRDYFCDIEGYAKKAIECINFARQLDSSQSIKNLQIIDYKISHENVNNNDSNDLLTQLFDLFLNREKTGNKYPFSDNAFWTHSLWGQKLASLLYWSEYVKSKIHPDYKNIILPGGENEDFFKPLKNPFITIRSSILMRWVYARSMMKEKLYKNKKNINIESFDRNGEIEDDELCSGQKLKDAYEVSRNLYFVILDINLISRKNLDLIYPTLTHIYYLQWKLLLGIINSIMEKNDFCKANNLQSYISVLRYVQKKFKVLDKKYGNRVEIAPSHFDYEFIYTKLKININDVVTINDPTSRARVSILQQKYFFHDDHSDQEFRMDWTLAHMFSPIAYYLSEKVEEEHEKLNNFFKK